MCNCLVPLTVDDATTEEVISDVSKSQTHCHSWPSHVRQEQGKSTSLSHTQGWSLRAHAGREMVCFQPNYFIA